MLLKLALTAQLPLIEVYTRDVMNLPDVIQHISKKKITPWGTGPSELKPKTVYYYVWNAKSALNYEQLYRKLTEVESTLLVVNPGKPSEIAFKAGEVPVPRDLMIQFVNAVVSDEKKTTELMSALGGTTLKDAAEAVRLTMARDKSLTAKGLTMTRKTCFQGTQGLTQIDTDQTYYEPPEELVEFVEKEKVFFLNGTDWRLMPRGLLMDGPPGTGKTEASRFIAGQWGVPLYRIDMAGAKSKWHGESEQNVLAALGQLDHEEPCVVLFDEVEKIFGGIHQKDFGESVTRSVLSQLLWWLAERRTRVLTVMTTNQRKALPPELYREGRIDRTMVFMGLAEKQIGAFAKNLLQTYPSAAKKITGKQLEAMVAAMLDEHNLVVSGGRVSQAAVTVAVKNLVKEALMK
jgi:hypothetical protein